MKEDNGANSKEWSKFYLCDPGKATGCRKTTCAYKKSHKFACYRTSRKDWAVTDEDGNPISTLTWRRGTGLTDRARWSFTKFVISRTLLLALTVINVTLVVISTSQLVLL